MKKYTPFETPTQHLRYSEDTGSELEQMWLVQDGEPFNNKGLAQRFFEYQRTLNSTDLYFMGMKYDMFWDGWDIKMKPEWRPIPTKKNQTPEMHFAQ